MKLYLIGIWVAAVTLGSSYAAAYLKSGFATSAANVPAAVQYQKTRAISVPMIADGSVQGYVVAQFAYAVDPDVLKTLTMPPDVFLLDEAFRAIYSDDKLDFKHLERYDLAKLTAEVMESSNKRLGANLLKQVLVQDFNFVAKDASGK